MGHFHPFSMAMLNNQRVMVIGPAYPWAGTEIVCGGYSSPPRGDPLVQNRFSR